MFGNRQLQPCSRDSAFWIHAVFSLPFEVPWQSRGLQGSLDQGVGFSFRDQMLKTSSSAPQTKPKSRHSPKKGGEYLLLLHVATYISGQIVLQVHKGFQGILFQIIRASTLFASTIHRELGPEAQSWKACLGRADASMTEKETKAEVFVSPSTYCARESLPLIT